MKRWMLGAAMALFGAAAHAQSAPSIWYSFDRNKARCIEGLSPAERIRLIQDSGRTATTRDYSNFPTNSEASR